MINSIRIENGFRQFYENSIFEYVDCYFDDGTSKLKFRDGRETILQTSCEVYNEQYGLPVSSKHMKAFVGSWEKGLFCYDAITGELAWHMKGTRITKIYVFEDYVIAIKYGASIIKLDIMTGIILSRLNSRVIERTFPIIQSLIYVERLGRCHGLFDTEKFETYKKYPEKVVNPSDCLSLLIQTVDVDENCITICGVEKGANRGRVMNETTFSRIIDYHIL